MADGRSGMDEAGFLDALRALPLHPAARGLADDAAVLGDLVLTKDAVVEGVHYLPGDAAGDVAWRLVATNLSDLAAKGAVPLGALLACPIGDADWDRAFLAGLDAVLRRYDCPLLGGDTVRMPPGGARFLSLTAIGRSAVAPSRGGACAGDVLWMTGTAGDAGAGLAIARAGRAPPGGDAAFLLGRFRRPTPRLAEGRTLAPHVCAMMDVSDGVLIDARRMAGASGVAVTIDLALLPLSPALVRWGGGDRAARLAAATAGDDYELMFALPAGAVPPVPATRIGAFATGAGLALTDGAAAVPLPARLGFEHGAPPGACNPPPPP